MFDKPRAILYKLAKSRNAWERRTARTTLRYAIEKLDKKQKELYMKAGR